MSMSTLQAFILTTGETLYIDTIMNGEAWEWRGTCSFDEIGMDQLDEEECDELALPHKPREVLRCTTPSGDDTARMIQLLYDSQYDETGAVQNALWEEFCAAETFDEFRARVDELMQDPSPKTAEEGN